MCLYLSHLLFYFASVIPVLYYQPIYCFTLFINNERLQLIIPETRQRNFFSFTQSRRLLNFCAFHGALGPKAVPTTDERSNSPMNDNYYSIFFFVFYAGLHCLYFQPLYSQLCDKMKCNAVLQIVTYGNYIKINGNCVVMDLSSAILITSCIP